LGYSDELAMLVKKPINKNKPRKIMSLQITISVNGLIGVMNQNNTNR